MGKPSICGKTGLKKGMWTPEEDKLLSAYITRYGHWNWRQLPKYAGLLRCGKSCRLRWMNYLRPDLKRGNFTGQEEELIVKLHEQLGNRWSTIAESLPGRTDNEIKNQWHTHLNKPAKPKTPAGKKGKKKQVASQGSSHDIYITPVILESSDVLPLPTPMASTVSPLSVGKNRDIANVVTEDGSAKSASDFWNEPFFFEEDFMWEGITPNYPSEVYDDDQCFGYFL